MLINLSVNNVPTEPGKNPLTDFTGTLAKRAKLTKAMWLLVIFDALAVLAFLAYAFVPKDLKDSMGLRSDDIRMAYWIVFVLNVVLIVVFSIAEIVINYIHGRGFKE